MDVMDYCKICRKKVLAHAYQICCTICSGIFHLKCITLQSEFQDNIRQKLSIWSCDECNSNIFPFNWMADDDKFLSAVTDSDIMNTTSDIFHPFDLMEENDNLPLYSIDPDTNFYNGADHRLVKSCQYYNVDSFNSDFKSICQTEDNNPYSLCHINIRSIKMNLGSFEAYLNMLDHQFNIIGITETWLNDSTCGLYSVPGYKIEETGRREYH